MSGRGATVALPVAIVLLVLVDRLSAERFQLRRQVRACGTALIGVTTVAVWTGLVAQGRTGCATSPAVATGEHRWYARATLLAALATGVTLLLPWTFSRRLGLSVWQLGIEIEPMLALMWLAGLLTSVVALALKPGHKARAAAAVTGVIAVVYLVGAWQAGRLEAVADTWPGPGPAFAVTTSLSWLLTVAAQLVARHNNFTTDDPAALAEAVTDLRRTRL